jgi:hypothetical protein
MDMEKILSSLPFDRLCKAMTIFGLILTILPLSYLFSEKSQYRLESIRLDGKNNTLSQKEKNIERSFKQNTKTIEEVLKRDFTYEETHKRTAPLFQENKSYIKELDQIEIERINLKTEVRVLESNKQLRMEYQWILLSVSVYGAFLTLVGFLDWSAVEEKELKQALFTSKSQLKS